MGSYFCGGAHPTNEDFRSATFDLRTGKSVEFEGLFRDYGRDKRAILSTIFAEQIAEAAKHPEPSDVPDEKRSCADEPGLYALEALEESTYTFNFSPRGLEVQPEWPHVVQACEIRVTVPYGKLKPYAASRGLLERMLDRAVAPMLGAGPRLQLGPVDFSSLHGRSERIVSMPARSNSSSRSRSEPPCSAANAAISAWSLCLFGSPRWGNDSPR
jgi:hypothetical protein